MISILPKLMYRFNAVPAKTPIRYFIEVDKIIFKLIAKTILKKIKWKESTRFPNSLRACIEDSKGLVPRHCNTLNSSFCWWKSCLPFVSHATPVESNKVKRNKMRCLVQFQESQCGIDGHRPIVQNPQSRNRHNMPK